MSNFWPKGIEISDTQSPMQILETAQEEWINNSDGVMTLVLQEAKSKGGNDMIIVHAKHLPSNRTVTLFSVVYRSKQPYPATIEPKDDDLPDYLKKSYYKQSPTEKLINGSIGGVSYQGQQVKNTWVSDAPSEFRENLEQVFNLSIVKSDLLSLLSTIEKGAGDEPAEELTR
jgi:hypothetical protein